MISNFVILCHFVKFVARLTIVGIGDKEVSAIFTTVAIGVTNE